MVLSKDTNQPVAGNIRKILDENGIKQCFIAKKAKIPASSFSDMLTGKRIIRPCDVVAIAKALSVDTSVLFATKDADKKGGGDDGEAGAA